MTGTDRSVDRAAALTDWLALEREATWFYPYVGARVPDLADRARSAAASHAAVRDRLLGVVTADTTTAQPGYDVGPVETVANASTAARRLEQRIQAACLQVVATSTGDDRTLGLDGLRRAALAELRWSGRPRAFPGLAG